ncbi:hypothetical protein DH09_19305 [Bacillaceae bacterium JMAK1]|nr:hypothetical protein DH09_19305 [Bacillaceae bacterium JMAK1]
MKIATVVGARPQFMKAAMLSKQLQHRETLIHTGQHYDAAMSDVFFAQLQLKKPDVQLHHRENDLGSMIVGLEKTFSQIKPDIVIVYGDTVSTLAGSLAASKLQLPLAHIEAGLRSFNRRMPEEYNRVVSDHLASWCFCPTERSAIQLKKENVNGSIILSGDLMVDACQHYKTAALKESTILEEHQLREKPYYVATLHRAELIDDPKRLHSYLDHLQALDSPVYLPLHPRTKKAIEQLKHGTYERLRFLPPLPYFDMLTLMSHSQAILTDSGGIQKEAYVLSVPCFTLREETEWHETVATHWNTLVKEKDLPSLPHLVKERKRPRKHPPLFGEGDAATIIVETLKRELPRF